MESSLFATMSTASFQRLNTMQARHTDNQTKKRDQEFKSGMMELHAIRARLQEGIERNGNCDMKEVSRVSTTRELKVLSLWLKNVTRFPHQLQP